MNGPTWSVCVSYGQDVKLRGLALLQLGVPRGEAAAEDNPTASDKTKQSYHVFW